MAHSSIACDGVSSEVSVSGMRLNGTDAVVDDGGGGWVVVLEGYTARCGCSGCVCYMRYALQMPLAVSHQFQLGWTDA